MHLPETTQDQRTYVKERLRPTLEAPQELLQLELPADAARHLGRLPMRRAAVLVPLQDAPDGLHIVLTQRADNLRVHAGQISFPGGRSDPEDVDESDTALREAEEEINLDRGQVEIVGMLDDYPTGTGFRVTPVVGLVNSNASMRPDGVEAIAILKVPLVHVLDPSNYRPGSFVREGITLPFLEIHWHDHRIWGATAGMLRNLCDKLG